MILIIIDVHIESKQRRYVYEIIQFWYSYIPYRLNIFPLHGMAFIIANE